MQIGIGGQLNASDKCLKCLDTEVYSVVNEAKKREILTLEKTEQWKKRTYGDILSRGRHRHLLASQQSRRARFHCQEPRDGTDNNSDVYPEFQLSE